MRHSGAHPPLYLYLWGGWGAATSAQMPLKAPRKCKGTAVPELGTCPGDAPSLGKG